MFSNIIGKVWAVLIALFLTPYIIHRIGVERYGLFAIVGVVTIYIGLLDFGVGSSFAKYIAEFCTQKDYRNLNNIINTGFAYYFLFSIAALVVALPMIDIILVFLKIPAHLVSEARFVFTVGIIIFCGMNLLGIFFAIPGGLLRLDIANLIIIGISILNMVSTIFFLERGWGLRGLMISNMLVFAINAFITVFVAFRLVPQLRFNPFAWDSGIFKRSFSFGWKVQVARISGTVTTQTDKILITYFLSLAMVTFYQLASGVVYYTAILPGLLSSVLVPAFSEIEAKGERRKLIEAYLQSTKYLTFFCAPLFIFVVVSAYRIMNIWMGQGYGLSAFLIQVLILSFAINVIASISSAVSMAMEKPQFMVRGSLITIVLNIPASIILIKLLGFSGVAWGTLVAVNLGTFYFLIRLHRELRLSLRQYGKSIAPFFLISILSGALIVLLDLFFSTVLGKISRLQEIIIFCSTVFVFIVAYLVGVYRANLFNVHDWLFFREKFPWVFNMVRNIFPDIVKKYQM
jgi:O-antigen/teichoic acid export membrane protein